MQEERLIQARTDFVTGRCSVRELAGRSGLPYGVLLKRAREENWRAKRKEYGERVSALAAEKCAEREADAIAALTDTADRVAAVFRELLADEKQFCRYIVQEKEGAQTVNRERVFRKRDVKSLREVTAALKDLTAVMRDLHEAPNLQERQTMELQKPKQLLRDEGEQQQSGVILMPRAEEERRPGG